MNNSAMDNNKDEIFWKTSYTKVRQGSACWFKCQTHNRNRWFKLLMKWLKGLSTPPSLSNRVSKVLIWNEVIKLSLHVRVEFSHENSHLKVKMFKWLWGSMIRSGFRQKLNLTYVVKGKTHRYKLTKSKLC